MAPIILHSHSHDGVPTIPSSCATPGPYERAQTLPWTHVPSLAYFCIRRLVDYPEYAGRVSLPYVPPETEGDPDILRTLIPSYSYFDNTLDYNALEPRLWAVIVQVFTGLPSCFSTYSLALSDKYLPLLQRVECTKRFSLIVVLDLSGSSNLRDETIHKLFELRHLAALDISKTRVSALGVKLLRPRTGAPDGHEGPRALRVLSLRGCKAVKDEVLEYLLLFPLLSAIDIRDTACSGRLPSNGGFPFSPCDNARLFHPTPHDLILANLQTEQPELHSSTTVYTLSVAQERYPALQRLRTDDELHDVGFDARNSRIASAGEGDAPEATDQLLYPPCRPATTVEKDQIGPTSDDIASLLDAPEVAEDSREFASRLNARQFYGVPEARLSRHSPSTVSLHRSSNRPFTKYRLEASAKPRLEIEDPRFTLYRPPPPYSSLPKLGERRQKHSITSSSKAITPSSKGSRLDPALTRLDPALISSNKDAVSKAAHAFLVSRKRPKLDAGVAWGMPTSMAGGQVGGQAAVAGEQAAVVGGQADVQKGRAAAAGGSPASAQGSAMPKQSAKATSSTPATKKANPFAAKRGGFSSRLGASPSSRPKTSSPSSSHISPQGSRTSSPPKRPNASPPKPLVPISALPRPEFPPDEIAKSLREAAKATKGKGEQKGKVKEKGEAKGTKDKDPPKPERQFDWTNWSRRGG
ncbi:uncharacterized protein SCHCODRAFT_02562968 [Schizophyllum commune H4-8]|uniref:uncharacterized protein n=1 Tax=Schizophyllum commune (strain H4-8 / FGSC 9210) TaxID=578458 RepID=UPI002160CADE|nr:uncharacterized protein SCHCODRAFT_02562968 [Schizophyllum commune H4-8]KAI5900400.1 hypothetical protein SCHCODRAFT_02562968 [Schizophyllum commune H4-8]